MKKKILIVGGTGFIGSKLAKKCLSLNWAVTSLSTSYPIKQRKLNFKQVYENNYRIFDEYAIWWKFSNIPLIKILPAKSEVAVCKLAMMLAAV